MALKKPTFEQEPAAAHSDTNQGDTAVAEKPAARQEVKQEVRQEPAAAATTAIAKASASAVASADSAVKAKAFKKEFEEMKGAADFSYGNYSVYKGSNGEICESGADGKSMGRWAQVRLLAWDSHYEVSPGESGASSKDFVAYSKDGKTLDSIIGSEMQEWVGQPVDEYMEYLRKEEEFSSAKTRQFIDTACAVLATDNPDGPVSEAVQITLSETSIPAFSRYQQKLINDARCVAMGLPGFSMPADPFTFYFIREVATKGSNKWTKLRIESELPAKF